MPEERDDFTTNQPEQNDNTYSTIPLNSEDDEQTVERDESNTNETEPRSERDIETADLPTYMGATLESNIDDEDDVPFKLSESDGSHQQITMPVFKEPGVPDPKKTLPGTFGLDPNPDFAQANTPAEPTMRNPAVPSSQPPRKPAIPAPTAQHNTVPNSGVAQGGVSRPGGHDQYTMPNPQLADQRYAAPGGYTPAPPDQSGTPSLPRRRTRRRILGLRPGCLWMIAGLFVTFCGGLTLMVGAAAAIFVPRIEQEWTAQIAAVDDYQFFQSTFIYDRNGEQLWESFGEGRRTTVDYEQFPQRLIEATIAIEDDSFFENAGIDVAATFVAAMQYLGADPGEQTPGGSTITQQLVRNVLFDFEKRAERSIARKAEEIMLALVLTQSRSKQDILEMYLNEIYYGNLAYGAQTAAQTFFAKDVEELTIGEAALLAGLPQAPADLDPLNPDPEVQGRVDARWRQVLNEMVEEGFITDAERNQALSQGLSFSSPEVSLKAPHFTVYAQDRLEDLMIDLGYTADDITRGGLRVYTTLDLRVNDVAQAAAREQVARLQSNNVSNAAVAVIKPITGEILAMVGSIDYNNDVIDGRVNVTTALRQPGSTMKPFTYSAAIERGMSTGDVIWDTRTEIGIPGQPLYEPRNYDGSFHGPMTMRTALANSYNIPAVQTLRLVGVDYLLEVMRRFGVETLNQDASQYGLSLTLGGGEVSLLELTNAYAVFGNQGSYVEPRAILCIIDSDDNILYQYENSCPEGRMTDTTVDETGFGRQVLDPRIAYIITDMLSDNGARSTAMGSNSPLRTDGIATSVKTGTTNDVKDNWTVGYTRNVAIGVWVGNNNGDPMVNSSGLTGAAPIWNSVMNAIYQNPDFLTSFAVGGQLLQDQPQPPPGMSRREICDVRRLTDPSVTCGATITEWFLDGPAGIPDADGILQYPQQQIQGNPVPTSGSYIEEISPGVYKTIAFPIPDPIAASIQFDVGPGEKQPLPPKYCRVPVELISAAAGAQEMVFIAGPSTSQSDAVEAERYARQRGLAYLPTIDCWQDVFTAAVQSFGPQVTTAVISSPSSGQVLTEPVPVIGTVQFNRDQADFYHLYIQGGQFQDWTALGNPHQESVTNGVLEELHVPSLQPGTYRLRLALVKGGDFIQQPYEVVFTVP